MPTNRNNINKIINDVVLVEGIEYRDRIGQVINEGATSTAAAPLAVRKNLHWAEKAPNMA